MEKKKDYLSDKQSVDKDVFSQRTELAGTKVNVTTLKIREHKTHDLKSKYDIARYDLTKGYVFPADMMKRIPRDTPEYVESGERYVERMMRALFFFKQCALVGPSGTGKTHISYLVAELAGLPMWEINCGLQTSVYDLFGRYIGLGKENWIDGQIVSWCRYGGILYLDEANMMRQDVATLLNPVLDTRGHLVLNEKDSELIERHPMAYMMASMNPFSSEFAGTKPLNAAFRRRMTVWINFDYLSVGERISSRETDLVEKKGSVDHKTAENIVKVGAELRRQYQAGDLPYGPSIGDLVNWAKLSSDGQEPQSTAEETIIAMTSDNEEVQEEVRVIIRNVFSGF